MTLMIPFLDLKPVYRELQPEWDEAYHRVMISGRFLLGPETEQFEHEYARYCGTQHCVTVANGLEALSLALRAWGIGPGDEVIVPTHTFIATWLAVSHVGAIPVPVEVELATYNLDVTRIEKAITRRTRAIIPVHLYGLPADMDPIRELANRHQLRVLEDAAQSQGALYKGKRTGCLGDAAAFSFYPAKNLGALSDAGALTTDDSDLAKQVRELRNYGCQKKYHHNQLGYNSRIDEFQAAILRIKLRHLDEWNSRRSRLAQSYQSRLNDISGFALPTVPDWADPAWHLFVIRCADRQSLQDSLHRDGIGTQIHYPIPPHLSAAYQETGFGKRDFPIAEAIADTVLSLPIGPHQDPQTIDPISDAIRAITFQTKV